MGRKTIGGIVFRDLLRELFRAGVVFLCGFFLPTSLINCKSCLVRVHSYDKP